MASLLALIGGALIGCVVGGLPISGIGEGFKR